ncbi:DUF6438 domain-containing protein [Chryseobacterium arachidis]|uniref:DUF6438 domain-containing protein n=1 Tax=Chryseobacterium arachidis TaxID=1416778 RepID=UPI0036141190
MLLLILFTVSCNSSKKQNIVGEWILEEKKDQETDEPPMPFARDPQIFIFNQDGTYINKNGYFKRIENAKWDENKTLYLGEKTQYKIKDDSLLIFNLIENKFESNKILQITKSKIVLELKDKSLITLISTKSKQYKNTPIDKIVVSKSACYGSCPINSTIIDVNGDFLFYGERYNLKNGFFKSEVSSNITQGIFNEIKNIDIKSLKPEYSVSATDLPSSTITFISKGKIIKTIYDYGGESPFELKRLIRNISYLYQTIPLQPISVKDPSLIYNFTSKTKRVSLEKESERFYLFNELLKAKIINKNLEKLAFSGKYLIDLPEDYEYDKMHLYERHIYTNGQIFNIQLRDKTIKTLDLGYNFFDKNNLIRSINDTLR